MRFVRQLLIWGMCCFTWSTNGQAAVFDVVKVYPKKGEPIILRDFYIPWSHKVDGRWNEQRIEIKVSHIKSLKFIKLNARDRYSLDAEVTLKDGTQVIVSVDDLCTPCEGDTQSDLIRLDTEEIIAIDFEPDPVLRQ